MATGISTKLKALGVAAASVVRELVSPQVGKTEIAELLGYATNAGAPSSIAPDYIGQKLLDTTNGHFYRAWGTSAGNWSLMAVKNLSLAELQYLDGAGTPVVASKAVIADPDKDIVGLRKIWLGTNGAGGFAGEIDIQDGGNPGNSAALAYADMVKLDAITDGTVAGNKAAVPDVNKDLGDFRNLDVVNLDAGASGTAGSVDVFPGTGSKGKLTVSCADQDGDTVVTLKALGMAQATEIDIPDPGAVTAYQVLSSQANDQSLVNATNAEINAAADVSARLVSVPDNASYAVLAANSGKPHIIPDQTATVTLTLPAVASGLEFTFIFAGITADAQDWIINTGADANYFLGGLVHLDTDADAAGDEVVPIAGDGNSNSKCTIKTPNVGTRINVLCDGTHWVLSGYSVSATVPSFADQ